MKWQIPAKTFILGEYAAIAEASAILITTEPYFELTLTADEAVLSGIHSLSPAGLWWQAQSTHKHGLTWHDPYHGQGGFGASSAQFIACYLATCHIQGKTAHLEDLLQAYYKTSWSGTGLRPSGYDVIAQSQQGCVFINRQRNSIKSYSWPFQDLSITLLHTGTKLATHTHLQNATLPPHINQLSEIVDSAALAFENADSFQLIKAINNYHDALSRHQLVAEASLKSINTLRTLPEVLAIKGCGALGADVILIITKKENRIHLRQKLEALQLSTIATEDHISHSHSTNPLTIAFNTLL